MAVPVVVLLLLGPWLIYLLCPVPDQIVEYRCYSMCAGMAIGLAVLMDRAPALLWLPLLAGFAALTASRATAYSSPIRFWTEAAAHSSGDPSRAFQELGAWTKVNAKSPADLSAAEKYFREALRINPKLGPALNNLGWILIQKRWMGEPPDKRTVDPEGRKMIEACVRHCPEYAISWQDMGTILEQTGEAAAARAHYERALELDPTMEVSLNRLGLMEFAAGRPDKALTLFELLSALNPTHWEYTYNRAVTMKHAGQKEAGHQLLLSIPQPFIVTPNMLRKELAA